MLPLKINTAAAMKSPMPQFISVVNGIASNGTARTTAVNAALNIAARVTEGARMFGGVAVGLTRRCGTLPLLGAMLFIVGFAGVPDRQYKYSVMLLLVAIKSEIRRSAARNDQLSETRFCAATYERVVCQDFYGLNDVICSLLCKRSISFQQETDKSF